MQINLIYHILCFWWTTKLKSNELKSRTKMQCENVIALIVPEIHFVMWTAMRLPRDLLS